MPSPSAARKFLYEFHEEAKIEEAKQRRTAEQIAYIAEETEPLVGLGVVNRELVRELGRRCPDQRIATVDQDATIIESRKQEALRAYEGGRGAAVWLQMCGLGVLPVSISGAALPAPSGACSVSTRGWRPAALPFRLFCRWVAACMSAQQGIHSWAAALPVCEAALPSGEWGRPGASGGSVLARHCGHFAFRPPAVSWRCGPTLKGIRAGKDEVLDRAVQYLQSGDRRRCTCILAIMPTGTPVHRGWAARRVSGPGTTIATPMGKNT